MRAKRFPCGLLLAAALLAGPAAAPAQQKPKKEYLTRIEADRVRDAETPALRIKLFISFAADRIKKIQYELSQPAGDARRAERINGLLNAYTGCLDDAAELIELGRDKQEDIRAGVKEMQAKAKEFLAYLEGLSPSSLDRAAYQQNLEDAIEATRDALREAVKAAKEIAPGPVRRKP